MRARFMLWLYEKLDDWSKWEVYSKLKCPSIDAIGKFEPAREGVLEGMMNTVNEHYPTINRMNIVFSRMGVSYRLTLERTE